MTEINVENSSENLETIVVTHRNKNGVDTGKTDCVDFGRAMNTRFFSIDGSKIKYSKFSLRIGRCLLKVKAHRTFGGSWCAEEFLLAEKEFIKLMMYLHRSKFWDFEYLDEDHELLLNECK